MKRGVLGGLIPCLMVIAMFLLTPSVQALRNNEVQVPVNGTWVSGGHGEAFGFVFEVEKSSTVTVQMHSKFFTLADLRLYDNYHSYRYYPDVPFAWFHEIPYERNDHSNFEEQSFFLAPGKYLINSYCQSGDYTELFVRVVTTTPANYSEREPNDHPQQAQSIEPNEKISALMTIPEGADYYKINLTKEETKLLTISARFPSVYVETSDSKGRGLQGSMVTIGGSPEKAKSVTVPVRLAAGISYICLVTDSDTPKYGPYSIILKSAPESKSIKIPKSLVIPTGLKTTIKYTISPTKSNPYPLEWKSSSPSVATVNQQGLVTAKKKGKTIITVTTSNGKKASCAITVPDNIFSRNKPITGKKKGLYISTKKLYYKGSYLMIELFVYNKTGYTLKEADYLEIVVYDLKEINPKNEYAGILYRDYLDPWTIGSLRNNSYKVFKTKIKTSLHYDLTQGQYEATLWGSFYRKSLQSKNVEFIPAFDQ